ncbi:MAG: gliding motility-associated C-terminal domain-containing protein [Flavobacteriales bacterium]|nr:gliding motility-associated C-terminal domain-containing protein [Flavobacteriales bacterium]
MGRNPDRMLRWSSLFLILLALNGWAQPCLVGYNYTAAPPPVAGEYQSGQTVTFCFTVTNWNSTNANWFHGIVPTFGSGWDITTLVPAPPPATCGGSGGTWGWYPVCTGVSFTAIGPVGPGYFFDLNNDGNPGNNFGDFCVGAVNWQFCWDITVADGIDCVQGADLTITVNTYGDSETGSWGSVGCTGDAVVPSAAATSACCTANAGTNSAASVCSDAGTFDLFNALGGTPDAGGTWTDPNSAPLVNPIDPSIAPSGTYTYLVVGPGPNCEAQAEVSLTIVDPPEAGVDATLTLCSNGAVTNLFNLLGPTAEPGGSWSGPSPLSGSNFDPSVNSAGVYTYSVSGTAPCSDASATVNVSITTAPDPGSNTALTLCDQQGSVDLFASLGGSPDPGGTWSGPGPLTGNSFDPATGIPGVYSYTVAGAAPCADASANITVAVNAAANAGLDGMITVCSDAAPIDLFSLLGGGPDAGGTWTDPNGLAFFPPLDPGSDPPGTYTYLVDALAPCLDDQSTVQVTVSLASDPGVSSVIDVCSTEPPFDLITALGGTPDPGGTWLDPSNDPVSPLFDPATGPGGTYTYLLAGNVGCPPVMSMVDITLSDPPNAGSGGVVSYCSSDGPQDLFTVLLGSPQLGGSWTDPNGGAFSGTFIPGTSIDGDHHYTVAGIGPCPADIAVVNVSTEQAPSAGSNGSLTACTNGTPVDLFLQLGGSPDAAGLWTDPNGAVFGGILDPGIHPPGTYTYEVSGSGVCPSASAQVSVTLNMAPDAGADASLTLCSTDVPVVLTGALAGAPDLGGTWSDQNAQIVAPVFDPAIHPSGTYTYLVSGTAPCPDASSTLTVDVVAAPPDGIQGSAVLCSADGAVDLLTTLSGVPAGGSWSGPNGAAFNGSLDPGTDPPGVYTYSLPGTPPCPVGSNTVSVQIDQTPDAGNDAQVTFCDDEPASPLFPSLGPQADAGGTWTTPNGGPFSGNFDPLIHPTGLYTYSVNGSGACSAFNDLATVLVETVSAELPEVTVTPVSGCVPLQVDLQVQSPVGGAQYAWSPGDGSSVNGAVSSYIYSIPGQYSLELTVTDPNGCVVTGAVGNGIDALAPPVAQFQMDPTTLETSSPTVNLSTLTSSANGITWSVNGTSVQSAPSFAHTFVPPTVGEHVICLTVTDPAGCSSVLCRTILIDDALTVHVPNSFTPDGDGINDVFLPVLLGNDASDHELLIFDRWGSVVFASNDPSEGWNGALRNAGEVLRDGVYAWRLKVRDRFGAERRLFLGHVTLLK